MNEKFIAVEGVIGAGKTTLARMLAEASGSRLLLERFEDNPFLERFYSDPERYAFATEMSFLADRFQQYSQEVKSDLFQPGIVADYAYFKSLLFAQMNLGAAEYGLYRSFFDISFRGLPRPDLVLHLHRPVEILQSHIAKRARAYEQRISNDYLQSLQQIYLDHYKKVTQFPVLFVQLEDADFVGDEKVFQQLQKLLEQEHQPKLSLIELNKI